MGEVGEVVAEEEVAEAEAEAETNTQETTD